MILITIVHASNDRRFHYMARFTRHYVFLHYVDSYLTWRYPWESRPTLAWWYPKMNPFEIQSRMRDWSPLPSQEYTTHMLSIQLTHKSIHLTEHRLTPIFFYYQSPFKRTGWRVVKIPVQHNLPSSSMRMPGQHSSSSSGPWTSRPLPPVHSRLSARWGRNLPTIESHFVLHLSAGAVLFMP